MTRLHHPQNFLLLGQTANFRVGPNLGHNKRGRLSRNLAISVFLPAPFTTFAIPACHYAETGVSAWFVETVPNTKQTPSRPVTRVWHPNMPAFCQASSAATETAVPIAQSPICCGSYDCLRVYTTASGTRITDAVATADNLLDLAGLTYCSTNMMCWAFHNVLAPSVPSGDEAPHL
ncbi:uncharacterized protein LY79DRAFT_404383 [Colletotrichum navitas]|uniref:Uncharacterized protein n=1 Tax=Colletotrichum navitas TaxID=681940 RepID=A0AAD8Q6Z1_9PEZI|nr:uncharacterized protein LY79DRAFT_404383 [Colletotrichum navitas]KAK1597076.1 hypothetical protein LY79DRAFT_404383 [Colletotrichum navitas]